DMIALPDEVGADEAQAYRRMLLESIQRDPSEEFRAVLNELAVGDWGIELDDVFAVYSRLLDHLLGLGDTARALQSLDELAIAVPRAQHAEAWERLADRLAQPSVLRKLIAVMEHGTTQRREQVARLVRYLGPDSAAPILSASEFLESSEAWGFLRDSVVGAVGGHPSRLMGSLQHASSRVVMRAVQVLSRLESDDVPKYLALVARHPEASVRAEVLGAQIGRNPPTRLALIGGAMNDDSPLVRGRAIELLRQEDPAVAVPVLLSLLTTGHLARWGGTARQLYIETLSYFDSGEVYGELTRLVERWVADQNDVAGQLALDCLRSMKTVGAKRVLRRLGVDQ
ncbi:MAG: hypothetical protein KC609_21400, partial [Myxococcales bacterium]|nr:hypothetical protein [Myxococcales bacterium]